jgi:hypothetical protein
MTCDDVLNNGLVFVDVYICVYVVVRFEFELYMWLDLNLNYFFARKSIVGEVLD